MSDTHCRLAAWLDEAMLARLEGVAAILHAGDVTAPDVLRRLEAIAPTLAVKGNCDDLRLPRTRTFRAGAHTIGLVHQPPADPTPDGLFDLFAEEVHCVVHGHTHRSRVEEEDGVLIVNPGSARQPRDGWLSVGVIEAGERLTAEILRLRRVGSGD